MKGTKYCLTCGILKSLKDFTRDRSRKSGHREHCKPCAHLKVKSTRDGSIEESRGKQRAYYKKNLLKMRQVASSRSDYQRNRRYLKTYGITLVEYNVMLQVQDNCCKICRVSRQAYKAEFSVDHDHKTGKVRGLLCHKCNRGLGMFNDSPELLSEAIQYLLLDSKHKKGNNIL